MKKKIMTKKKRPGRKERSSVRCMINRPVYCSVFNNNQRVWRKGRKRKEEKREKKRKLGENITFGSKKS